MKAKEMFEKLGYELIKTTNPEYEHLIMYKRNTPQHIQRISFDNKSKKFACACLDDTYIKKGFRMKNTPMHCDIEHLQAINKQVEELGWIYE